eukprot:COSAG01_NODE_2648_length_7319_cov_7.831093_4_plen_197_part_00
MWYGRLISDLTAAGNSHPDSNTGRRQMAKLLLHSLELLCAPMCTRTNTTAQTRPRRSAKVRCRWSGRFLLALLYTAVAATAVPPRSTLLYTAVAQVSVAASTPPRIQDLPPIDATCGGGAWRPKADWPLQQQQHGRDGGGGSQPLPPLTDRTPEAPRPSGCSGEWLEVAGSSVCCTSGAGGWCADALKVRRRARAH